MAVCPKCGGANIKFHREPVGTSYNSYYRRTGVKSSWIFPSGIRNGHRKIAYRTVGLCSDCGHTWEIESEVQHSGWWYLFLLAIWPIALSVWFWKTPALRLDKRWRAAILSVAWLILIAGALSSEVERSIESNSIWASSYADLDDFEYYIDGNEIYIKDYRGSSKKVSINSSYDVEGTAMNVVSFDGTFALDSVTSVIIPNGTRYVSNNIFNSCGIEFVYLPASLEEFKGWSYFHNVEKIYYGGTEEQWSSFCTVDRSKLDVVQIICNTNPNELK
ncbi:MAG: hypothetical protein HFG08_09065 [Oscillibacter sp.]|jgi:hypothetical protein|nr:hypothetical protein [Oscillibacter sp.]